MEVDTDKNNKICTHTVNIHQEIQKEQIIKQLMQLGM